MLKNYFYKHTRLLKCIVFTRDIVIVFMGLFVAIYSLAIFLSYENRKENEERYNKTPILLNLPTDIQQSEKAFNERIKSTYPVGSNTKKIIADLAGQGFKIIESSKGDSVLNYDRSDQYKYILTFDESSSICSASWTVRLKSTTNYTITEINGSHSVMCF